MGNNEQRTMKKFVLRDDDLNHFSSVEDILWYYDAIFSKRIPVGFAIIPFMVPASGAYSRGEVDEYSEYPVSKNKTLVDYVRANKNIEVLQHGCTHLTENGVFEYQKKDGLGDDTKRGKAELESAFGTKVDIFVAPHDSFSKHALYALEANHMNILRGYGSKNFLFRRGYFVNFFKMVLFKIYRLNHILPYPYILDFNRHREAYCCRLADDNFDELKRSLEFVAKKNGDFVLTNHLHHRSEKRKEILCKVIQLAKELGFEFSKPSELFK